LWYNEQHLCQSTTSFFFPSRRRPTSFSRDWSSDVCSSDLFKTELLQHLDAPFLLEGCRTDNQDGTGTVPKQHLLDDQPRLNGLRSEERRVGKEGRALGWGGEASTTQ